MATTSFTLTLTAYSTPTPVKMTGKHGPTISCSHLMVELSVLAGLKFDLKRLRLPPLFGRRGLKCILTVSQSHLFFRKGLEGAYIVSRNKLYL